MVAARPSSRRSASRTLRVTRRRDRLSWSDAAGLLLVAILLNAGVVYSTSIALARSLEPKPLPPKREKVVEFDLVSGPAGKPSSELRPAPAGNEVEVAPREARPRDSPPKAKPGPARDDTEVADALPEGSEQVGDESLVVADDGELPGAGTAPVGRPDPLARLGGSTSVLDQTFGRSAVGDRMSDIDDESTSILDNKRHLFGSFFNRLRDGILENWQAQKALDRSDPDGSRYGNSSRTTVLMVRLNGQGEIVKLKVTHESGAPYLDEEAERAVRAAAPFPNLPEGLLDEGGHIDLPLAFTVDIHGVPRIYRH